MAFFIFVGAFGTAMPSGNTDVHCDSEWRGQFQQGTTVDTVRERQSSYPQLLGSSHPFLSCFRGNSTTYSFPITKHQFCRFSYNITVSSRTKLLHFPANLVGVVPVPIVSHISVNNQDKRAPFRRSKHHDSYVNHCECKGRITPRARASSRCSSHIVACCEALRFSDL